MICERMSVLDVSSIMHIGNKSKNYDRSYYGYRVGGIHFLMRHVCLNIGNLKSVVLAFDSPESKRKEIWAEYKSGRDVDYCIAEQIESIYHELQQIGFCCIRVDGYEADDIINWCVKDFKDQCDSIDVISNDVDLTHCVQYGVRFKSITGDKNSITVDNFESSIFRDEVCVFNTISARKVFCGCKSDGIPSLTLECGMNGKEVYGKFCSWIRAAGLNGNYAKTSDYRIIAKYVLEAGFFTQKDADRIIKRIKLIYPMKKPEGVNVNPTFRCHVDDKKFERFLNKYNDLDSLRYMEYSKRNVPAEDVADLKRRASIVATGEYAVDHNLRVDRRESSSLNIQGMNYFEEDY